uniref:Uncharacterized protein n=1 Tax=Helianthus annuus TaxID=4232 RepID=A0A251U2E0_HELAN
MKTDQPVLLLIHKLKNVTKVRNPCIYDFSSNVLCVGLKPFCQRFGFFFLF